MPELIEIPFGKGCVLMLTPTEFRIAVKRGKSVRRKRKMLQRLSKKPAEQGRV